ncbi:MAG: aminodeoxychorismate/anthranilate synthase component II [Lachnospiraceae bacterium]|nr:aminodeoxychorismate/anthranilate synthase component II [Lachnospiraceae bacterium]
MILLIDNYDSFSYNLYQLIGSVRTDICVIRNDALTVEEMAKLEPDRLILSPGPGRPADAGRMEEAIRYFAGKVPIFGVCLGHQAICETFGAAITYAKELMHGKKSDIRLDTDCPVFRGMEPVITGARYHSLAVDEATLPECLKVVGRTKDGEVMAVAHREYPIYGVQFHPESILTPAGREILVNFL